MFGLTMNLQITQSECKLSPLGASEKKQKNAVDSNDSLFSLL